MKRRTFIKTGTAAAVTWFAAPPSPSRLWAQEPAAGALESEFLRPPAAARPRPACHVPAARLKSKLQLDDRAGAASDTVSWKLSKGDLTSILDLRDPTTTNDNRLCPFDQGGAPLA